MGLDITAYSRLEYVGRHTEEWCEDYEHHVQAFAYAGFEASFRGIPIVGSERGFILGGCFEKTADTKTHGFRAGSYSGYNRWRADLADQFNPDADPDGPFYELIYFADNEGSIGPEAARDLLADFEQNADAYRGDEWDRGKYDEWTKAFRLAADGGLVDFH